jgi:inhibitor of cysteine peptidase
MTKNTRIYIVGLVLIAAISATTVIGVGMLTSPKQQPAPPAPVPPCTEKVVYANDSGSTIKLNKGDTLKLSLNDYGDGGYSWVITSQDKAKLSLVSSNHVNGSADALGDFGTDVWTFKAITPGTSTLTLACQRPWATNDTCARFSIQVVVQ